MRGIQLQEVVENMKRLLLFIAFKNTPKISLIYPPHSEMSNVTIDFSFRGRFGQVHKCIENSSGLTLAAKIIKARSPKEKVQKLREQLI